MVSERRCDVYDGVSAFGGGGRRTGLSYGDGGDGDDQRSRRGRCLLLPRPEAGCCSLSLRERGLGGRRGHRVNACVGRSCGFLRGGGKRMGREARS